MAGKKSLQKGKRGEYQFRKLCEKYNVPVVNTAEDKSKPDLCVGGLDCEVKNGQHVPSKIFSWIEEKNANCLAIKRNRKDWLVVMPYTLFFQFLGK